MWCPKNVEKSANFISNFFQVLLTTESFALTLFYFLTVLSIISMACNLKTLWTCQETLAILISKIFTAFTLQKVQSQLLTVFISALFFVSVHLTSLVYNLYIICFK